MDVSGYAIDTLNLRLPPGFANRADAIARQVGRELARWPVNGDARVPQLQLPRIVLHGGETNQAIARRIAREIHRRVSSVNSTQGRGHGVS